ncbi:MAG: hypothetical protein ABEJ26_12165 [Halosimplex sp.]
MDETLGDIVRRGEPAYRLFLPIVLFLVLLFLFSLPTVKPGTTAYYLTIANFFILSTALLMNLGLLYYCRRGGET